MELNELIAKAIEVARHQLAVAEPPEKRHAALVVTKLEEAALWRCQAQAEEQLGENALTDWLRGI
jgi:hypothetical protein